MNHLLRCDDVRPAFERLAAETQPARFARAIDRAAAELRRGTPVLLDGRDPLVVLGAEAATGAGLEEFAALSDGGEATLLLGIGRAAAVLRRPVAPDRLAGGARALRLPRHALDPAVLLGLADPTARQVAIVDGPAQVAAPPAAAAALTLAKLARLLPAAVVAGAGADAGERADALGLLRVDAAAVLEHAATLAPTLVRVTETALPLEAAPDTRVVMFRAPGSGIEHMAIVVGDPRAPRADGRAPLVRIHSECFTGDLLGSLRCDCGPQLRRAIARIAAEGAGAVLYLAQEGRGIGLANKLRAYALQDRGLDTMEANHALGWEADERNFLIAAAMLADLGLSSIRLLTNNPDKVAAIAACGVAVVREPHVMLPNGVNDRYLATKTERFGHLPE